MTPFEKYGGYTEPPPPIPIDNVIDPFEKYGGRLASYDVPNVIEFHEKLQALFIPSRYKILEGGRGSMKSWGVARALLIRGLQQPLRILCCREYQTSIEDSVHQLLSDQIALMGLSAWYDVKKSIIRGHNGTTFRFLGLGDMSSPQNRTKVKSFEGVDIVWIEEAESIPAITWEKLIPTIRKAGSEIWIVYNPDQETDPTYQRFHEHPPPGSIRIEMNWRDNLWFSDELRLEKDHLFAVDAEAAAHVWDGQLRKHAHATVYRDKYEVHPFETPANATFYHGVDWGYSNDPTVMIRMFITGVWPKQELWIDQEAWKIGCEISDLVHAADNPEPGLFNRIPTAATWPILADSARPELVSHVAKTAGWNMKAAEKWEGCEQDGIAHIRGFIKIHVHSRCKHTAEEMRLYKWKVDKMTGEVLNVLVDKHNHCCDAMRYGLGKFIQRRGPLGVWAKLGAG